MTSVGVVWSAARRIKCFMDQLNAPESLPKEGEQLLRDLEKMMELLREGGHEEVLEKKIVRLSYEIVDAVVDASKVAKWMRIGGNSKLQELQKTLNDYQRHLSNNSSSGEEKTAASEMAATDCPTPKTKYFLFRRNSGKPNDLQGKPERTSSSCNSEILLQEPEQSSDNKLADFKELKMNLLNPSSEDSVVFIVGESGMGKTTFTKRLFQDPELQKCFDANCVWIPINNDFKIKKVLQLLLQKLKQQDLDIRAMNEIQLIANIFAALKYKKNLIVLDDIGAIKDWESIRLALPTDNSTKVIVTTSSTDFLRLPNSYQISGLTENEIGDHPTFKAVSEDVMKAIFDISGGSPLLATILGKSLQPEDSAANKQLVNELRSYMPHRGKPQVLEACYKRLAPELKPCILYLGQFPHGQDIQVEMLYELLTAENLILPSEESEISLKTLTNNLKELAAKSFVEMGEDDKSCRLHDRVREFCISKGSEEEFFEVVDLESSKTVGPYTRRLTVYLSEYGSAGGGDNPTIRFQSQGASKNIWSLIIFDTFESAVKKSEWPSEMNDANAFTNARVAKFDGVDFIARKVPKWIDRLELLRYLSFRGCRLVELPSFVSNLKQLETLDLVVDEDCKKMRIPSNFFAKMTRMVNLYLPKLYGAINRKKVQLQGMKSLEILVNFDTEACDIRDLYKFKKLKTLSTISREQTSDLEPVIKFINEQQNDKLQHLFVDITGFNCYIKDSMTTLKMLLECQIVYSIHIEGRIGELPMTESHAENVAEIFLEGCEIEDDPMKYLGKFERLQRLVLANDAILGSEILISAGLLPKLRSMKLYNLQYVNKITIERGALPVLSTLQIHNCDSLKELSIPKELDHRLQIAQSDNGGDVYSFKPLPTKFNIISHDQEIVISSRSSSVYAPEEAAPGEASGGVRQPS